MAQHDRRRRTKKPAAQKPSKQNATKSSDRGRIGSRRDKPENSEKIETVAGTGTVILSKGALLGRISAWVLAAFLVGTSVVTWVQAMNPPAQAEQILDASDDATTQQAGDYAQGFVGSWLRATRDDTVALERYKSIIRGEITAKEPAQFRDLSVASVETSGNGIYTVLVSAEVLTEIRTEGQVTAVGDPKSSWVPSWFHVNVQHGNAQFQALGWPAPVPTPQTGVAPQMSYTYAGSEDLKKTIEAFFRAYVLNEGEVSRMIHPESTIQALGTNPYTTVKVSAVTTDTDFEKKLPSDGTSTHALVDIFLGTSADAARAATYALTLETRGGRWEVRTFDPAPIVATPAPTSQVTK